MGCLWRPSSEHTYSRSDRRRREAGAYALRFESLRHPRSSGRRRISSATTILGQSWQYPLSLERNQPACGHRLRSQLSGCQDGCLRTAGSAAAVLALIAGTVAGHDAAALGAEWSVAYIGIELERLLGLGLGGAEVGSIARFVGFRDAEKARAEPAENIVDDRFGVGYLRIASPTAGLEAHMAEFVDEEFQRHAVLQ